MTSQVIFWIFLLYLKLEIDSLAQMSNTELPEIIYEICPYSDVCNKTASRVLNKKGLIPCCTSCYCDEECGLRHDCCFSHLDKYKLVEKGKLACIDPATRPENEHVLSGYFMIKTCDTEYEQNNSVKNPCELTDENGNSLIAPVSSQETSFIYVNKECAVCNNIDMSRVKEWNYLLRSQFVHIGSIVTDVQNNLHNKFGGLIYIPPTDENWSSKRCYTEYIEVGECPRRNEWLHVCHNLQAPYVNYFDKVHRNVFCQLCKLTMSNEVDKECQANSMKGNQLVPTLTMLLDSAIIEASTLSDIGKRRDISGKTRDCQYGDLQKEKCLTIKCPEGKLQTPNGCSYFALRWYTPWTLMQVKLLPKRGTFLPVSKLPLPDTQESRQPFRWLKLPCRRAVLSSIEVFYSTEHLTQQNAGYNVTLTYVSSFIVRIWKDGQKDDTGVNPAVLVPLYQRCITETWQVTFGNEKYTFLAYFDKYNGYVQDGRQILQKWPHEGSSNWEVPVRPALYALLAEGPIRTALVTKNSLGITLTKPYFCNQVDVPKHDVQIKFGEILIQSRNISLGSNQYIVNIPLLDGNVNTPLWNKTTFSVCFDDYYHNYTGASRSTIFKNIMRPIIVCIAIVFFTLI